MDFGIARVLGTDRRTRVGFVVGTIGYMAPEQIQGMDVDGRADIYALGVVLYEMITGRVPFEGDSEYAVMQAQVQQMPVPPRVFASHIPVSLENTSCARWPSSRKTGSRQRSSSSGPSRAPCDRAASTRRRHSSCRRPNTTMIAAPFDETREHKSNPHLVSSEMSPTGAARPHRPYLSR